MNWPEMASTGEAILLAGRGGLHDRMRPGVLFFKKAVYCAICMVGCTSCTGSILGTVQVVARLAQSRTFLSS